MIKKKTAFLKKQPLIKKRVAPEDYSSEIALAGHSDAQVPQLMHFEPSIWRCPSASLIAPTGQSGSQVPQFTHTLGSIFIAIISTSFIVDYN